MPDVFVPVDTTYESDYLYKIYGLGIINQFAIEYDDNNRKILSSYKSAIDYQKRFNVDDKMLSAFIAFAEKSGVKKNEAGIKRSEPLIKNQLKANIARIKWQNEGLYPILQDFDIPLKKGLELLK